MKIDRQLLEKYNVPTPRYTSYPPANYFTDDFSYHKALLSLDESNSLEPQNISFYIHIPFCSQLCYYCGCNTHITKDKKVINSYVETLKKEILMYKKHISPKRKISQIHWGGGTPNYLDIEKVNEIMQIFDDNFSFIDNAEIAMECHPSHLTFEYIDGLKKAGFNRLSIGIQDIRADVLNMVNRALPKISLDDLMLYIHDKGFSVNVDFIYGLPGQDVKKFADTMKKASKLGADRLAVFSYAHVPWVKPHQKYLEKFHLPDAEQKTSMFEIAYEILTNAGYISIGLDHFAKPDDELSIALKNRTLHRNFQGYCTRRNTGQVYAFGVSGISQLASGYLQNTKDIQKYTEAVNKGIFPFEKAYFVNENERIIADIISEIMCNRYLHFDEIEKKYNLTKQEIKQITQIDEHKLSIFQNEGLLIYKDDVVNVTQKGMFFLRNIATSFDPLTKNSKKQFSKSL